METAAEDTPLLAGTSRSGSADESAPRVYKKQSRCFHLSVFIALVVLILAAIGATVWFFMFNKSDDSSNSNLPDFLKKFSDDSIAFDPNLSSDERRSRDDLRALLNSSWPKPDETLPEVSALTVPLLAVMTKAVDVGEQKLQQKRAVDVQPLNESDASFKHQRSIAESKTGNEQSSLGFVEVVASQYLHDNGVVDVVRYSLTEELEWTNKSGCLRLTESVSCKPSRYRSQDGSCNNVMNVAWGAAMKPFRRAMVANYSDGVSAPRGGFNTSLPSARDVSTLVHRPAYREDRKFTVMLAVWGQFIDHDISATALSRGPNGETIACCRSGKTDPDCFPVQLSSEDEYYSKYNITCMEFVRSAAALRCSFGPREQLNQVSSFLDGSMIYGSTNHLSAQLRTFKNGSLEMSYTKDGRALLPVSKNEIDGCNQKEEIKKDRYCFLSGDSRANENTHLTSMHLILARQHNKVAEKLHELNPEWDDEKLYQEARRIVAAQVQHITYKEFLPNILGHDMMEKLKLYPKNESYWTSYNASMDPTISNNFASSAFRFAHTLIPKMMKVLANDTSSPEYVEMHKMLFNPFGLYKGDLDSIMRGAMETPVERADNYFTEQVTEHLFESTTVRDNESTADENATKPHYGLDLVALNIQRGRDHGLPGYTKWRQYCNLSSAKSFEDLKPIFDSESLNIISNLYNSVDDIDLYTGALSEHPIPGGLVGPTLTCLIGDQFYRTKHGDRYWYETREQPQAFTPDQLDEIRKSSLAGIICQNSDNLTYITPAVMRSAGDNNERVPCSEIPQPDLSHWNESALERGITIVNLTHGGGSDSPWASYLSENETDVLKRIADARTLGDRNVWAEHITRTDLPSEEKAPPRWLIEWAANHSLIPMDMVFPPDDYKPQAPGYVVLPDTTGSENLCLFTIQARRVKVFSKVNVGVEPPLEILDREYASKTVMWSVNDTDSPHAAFTFENKSGVFALESGEWFNATCALLRPECRYYSKIVLGELANSKDLFEVSVTDAADNCSIIAPILLQGHYLSTDTFLWNGNITIYTRPPLSTLEKEDELSLHYQAPRKPITLPKVSGTLTLRERAVWNGTLPVVFETSDLSWYATDDTIVYPVSWSGFYDEAAFKGVFLMPQKSNGSIRWHDGSFTIDLPKQVPRSFLDLVRANRAYSSVVYLTDNPAGINRFDVSVFNKIKDWVFVDYSQIVLTGQFDKKGGFHWSGDINVLMPPLSVDLPSTTYQPYGKYLVEVNAIDLFAQLNSRGPVLKWWSGELPPIVLVPSGVYDPRLYANIINKYLIWSYNNDTVSTGAGQFKMFDRSSEMTLFGGFQFNFTFLMQDIRTSTLTPNTTYYSPILMQYERMTFDFGDDMAERLKSLIKPKFGTLAPITLLGEFHNNRTIFKWNHKCLVTVVDV